MTDSHEVIAAFVDGERIDSARLKEALADGSGRDYLVDVLALRELMSEQNPVPSPLPRSMDRRLRWGVAAAAMILVSAIGGYLAGQRHETFSRETRPNVETTTVPPAAVMAPPAPTRVIRLQPGVDWQERTGGH